MKCRIPISTALIFLWSILEKITPVNFSGWWEFYFSWIDVWIFYILVTLVTLFTYLNVRIWDKCFESHFYSCFALSQRITMKRSIINRNRMGLNLYLCEVFIQCLLKFLILETSNSYWESIHLRMNIHFSFLLAEHTILFLCDVTWT